MSSLVVEWCEFNGHRVVITHWRSRGHWCSTWPGLGGVLSTTAWDPAPVWVARSVCTRWWSSAPAWNWLLPCMKGLMCDTPHQHALLQHIPAEVMQLVHSCGLPKELSYLKAAAIGCEELADDMLVLHQLKSSLAQSECNMFQASIQELRTETSRLVLLFLATWPTSNLSSNRGRSWSTEP